MTAYNQKLFKEKCIVSCDFLVNPLKYRSEAKEAPASSSRQGHQGIFPNAEARTTGNLRTLH